MGSLVTYHDAREGFRRRELRQALYDAGHRLMSGVIVNLHGDPHVARRRLEQRLFRRDVFAWYEVERIPRIIDAVLAPAVAARHGDLLPLARRTMMTLSVDVAGVDLPRLPDGGLEPEVFDRFVELMERLARASTVAHATGDTAAIVADGDAALATFEAEFFAPALARRADLLRRFERGELERGADELPRDVLTTLLRNQDQLDLPPEHVLREVAYFPWVGSHSTSGQLVHAMHHVFEWLADNPTDRDRLIADDVLLQRFVHESMRLHPASPVALRIATEDLTLRSGLTIAAGDEVRVEVERANRDPDVFGVRPDEFDPFRELPDEVARWGLSFGHGGHACLGRELAGGLEPDTSSELHLVGSVTLMAGRMLAAGARPDPADPPSLDRTTTRAMWGRYPVRFGP